MTVSESRTVSVVIPTKNGGELFLEVMEELSRQRFDGEIEMLVVDSGSTDDTVAIAEQYGARVVGIDPSEFNHGLTRNLGIQCTSSEIVVLMTQDAVPANELLIENLFSAFDEAAIAGAYARQIPRSDADVITRRNLNEWLTGEAELRKTSISSRERYEALSPYMRYRLCNFDNVCSAIRRSVWQEIAFKKSNFGEDIEWGKAVLEAGWKIVYSPDACVIHSHNRSLWYEYKRTYVCHYRLQELFDLTAVPSLRSVVRFAVRQSLVDLRYIMVNERSGLLEIIRQMIRAPFLNILSAYAQYRGARDRRLGICRSVKGV